MQKKHFLCLLMLATSFALCGCRAPSPPQSPPAPERHPEWTVPLSPEQARNWSPRQAKAVLIAMTAVQQESKNGGYPPPDMMEIRPQVTPTGYDVYVQFAGAYIDGKPVGIPGGFVVVSINADWKVTRIIGGA